MTDFADQMRAILEQWSRGDISEHAVSDTVNRSIDQGKVDIAVSGKARTPLEKLVSVLRYLPESSLIRLDAPAMVELLSSSPDEYQKAIEKWDRYVQSIDRVERMRHLSHKHFYRKNPLTPEQKRIAEDRLEPPPNPPRLVYVDRETLRSVTRRWTEGNLDDDQIDTLANDIVREYGSPWCAHDDPAWINVEVVSLFWSIHHVNTVPERDGPYILTFLHTHAGEEERAVREWHAYWEPLYESEFR